MKEWILSKLLGALSLPQIITFILGTLAPIVVQKLVPPGELQTVILQGCASLMAILLVILRKPSDEGGSALKK